MEQLLSYSGDIAKELDKFLESQLKQDPNPWRNDLVKRLRSYTTGGKLLRGCLVCFSSQAYGKKDTKHAIQVAVALELVHAGLLIHDDIIDRDELRRGKPAMHVQYKKLAKGSDALHFGEGMAICVADAAMFMAFEILGTLNLEPKAKTALLKTLARTFAVVSGGQMLDIELSNQNGEVNYQTIMAVMEQKTAYYSVALPLVAGALIAGKTSEVTNLTELGRVVGIIFQIRDDELAVFGDTAQTGKPVGSDITEGKKTLIYYYLQEKSSPQQQERCAQIFGNLQATEADIEYVRELAKELRMQELINNEVEKLHTQATQLIDTLQLSADYKDNLRQLLAFCAKRNS